MLILEVMFCSYCWVGMQRDDLGIFLLGDEVIVCEFFIVFLKVQCWSFFFSVVIFLL